MHSTDIDHSRTLYTGMQFHAEENLLIFFTPASEFEMSKGAFTPDARRTCAPQRNASGVNEPYDSVQLSDANANDSLCDLWR